MRTSDPLFEMGLMLGGHRANNRFWQATLANVAARFSSPDADVETEIVAVDRRRQRRQAGNIRYKRGDPRRDPRSGDAATLHPPALLRPTCGSAIPATTLRRAYALVVDECLGRIRLAFDPTARRDMRVKIGPVSRLSRASSRLSRA